MLKRIKGMLPVFLVVLGWTAASFGNVLSAAGRVAVGTKVRNSVERRPTGEESFQELRPGTIIFDQDFVRTGSDAFLVMVYLDDKSMLKIKENSNLEILAERVAGGISKRIDMTAGTVKAEVPEQRKGEFVISTPTSTASVKGTSFWLISDPESGDQVFGLSGLVELANLISGNVITVGAGQTGFSSLDGSTQVGVTTAGDIPEDVEDTGEETKELRIRFRNQNGEERELIIQYD